MTPEKFEEFKKYIADIRSDLVDGVYHGSIDICSFKLTELPDLSDIIVDGNFWCDNNHLKNLKGAPKYVKGAVGVHCNDELTSLEGLPEIGDTLWISKETWDKLPKDTNEAMYILLNDKLTLIYK